MKIHIIIFSILIFTFIIALIDYLWYGKKITTWSKEEIIFWYFTRTIGELIAFTLGFILAWRLI